MQIVPSFGCLTCTVHRCILYCMQTLTQEGCFQINLLGGKCVTLNLVCTCKHDFVTSQLIWKLLVAHNCRLHKCGVETLSLQKHKYTKMLTFLMRCLLSSSFEIWDVTIRFISSQLNCSVEKQIKNDTKK